MRQNYSGVWASCSMLYERQKKSLILREIGSRVLAAQPFLMKAFENIIRHAEHESY